MRPANRREWEKVPELLDDVHAMHPDLTIGEVIQVASVLGDGESPWGAYPGAVTHGLGRMLEMPVETDWGLWCHGQPIGTINVQQPTRGRQHAEEVDTERGGPGGPAGAS